MNRASQASAMTNLILEIFRLNGQLLNEGDRLTKPLELTSARWQVLGAVGLANYPMSVAQIGRRMGLTRQAVQRVANDLKKLKFIRFENNPDHVRAKLIVPTEKGQSALNKIAVIQAKWSSDLAKGIDEERLIDALEVLRELQSHCEQNVLAAASKGIKHAHEK